MSSKNNIKKSKSVEEIYSKKTQLEHILDIPDTYIGSVEKDSSKMYVYDEEKKKIVLKEITYVPGLYKIFDEVLVNAIDHTVRDRKCRNIMVNIDKENNLISVWNDGTGIPVQIHKKENIYIPEMIFGHLLTSGNYNQKGKITGGKNGYGAKLANIYSTDFWIETVCSKNKKSYLQHFYNNMYGKDEPVINDISDKEHSYTKITFKPDLKRFGMDCLDDDIVSLFKKRVYDSAACTNRKVKVFLNDKQIKIKTPEDYLDMFREDESSDSENMIGKPIYEEVNDRWKIGVAYDPTSGHKHITYVNGICTFQGGTHVNYVVDKLVSGLMKIIKDKHKDVKVKNAHIKDNLTVYIFSTIEDPAFSSQIKDYLTTKTSNYGSTCDISENLIKNLSKTGIVDSVVDFARMKEMTLLKKSDGKKERNIKNMPKLEKALWAGTRKSHLTRLILTEGDSAKPLGLIARSIVGAEYIGVFPLKGKLLNVRDAPMAKIEKNEEIKNIKRILGLKQNKRYKDVKQLNYGGIIILTDQDSDGSHIKGLIINLIHHFWPSLLKIDGFIQTYATPIVKATKGTSKNPKVRKFYTMSEYNKWLEKHQNGWKIKYYKGLGTSTKQDAHEAFQNFYENVINFVWKDIQASDNNELLENNDNNNDNNKEKQLDNIEIDSESEDFINDPEDECNKAVRLAFAKEFAHKRKQWLAGYDKDRIIENDVKKVSIKRFINDELIHFSNYDNIRSIPGIDGLKPSQRKIVFGLFKKNLKQGEEIKVGQLSGHVSDVSDYHHGEASLQGAIINMAQRFVGTNNLNILKPIGQFGSRLNGGSDAASPRYIFTNFNRLVKYIFRDEDKYVIKHNYADGKQIEPEVYPTILPLVLANGTKGIGTGFSTTIPCFNPLDIVKNIKRLLKGKEPEEMIPWYRGFKGTINQVKDKVYESVGVYNIVNENTIEITELPVGTWTDQYKAYLESCIADDPRKPTPKKFLSQVDSVGTDTDIKIRVEFCKNKLQEFKKNLHQTGRKNKDDLISKLKLTSSIAISNMHLYNYDNVITKYSSPIDILKDFYNFRYEFYVRRKEHMIKLLENKMLFAKFRKIYIQYILDNKIIVNRKKKDEVIAQIEKYNFPKLSEIVDAPEDKKSYKYLTDLLIFHLTDEKIEELEKDYEAKQLELEKYKEITIVDLWTTELDEFTKEYKKWLLEVEDEEKFEGSEIQKKKKNIKKNRVKTRD